MKEEAKWRTCGSKKESRCNIRGDRKHTMRKLAFVPISARSAFFKGATELGFVAGHALTIALFSGRRRSRIVHHIAGLWSKEWMAKRELNLPVHVAHDVLNWCLISPPSSIVSHSSETYDGARGWSIDGKGWTGRVVPQIGATVTERIHGQRKHGRAIRSKYEIIESWQLEGKK